MNHKVLLADDSLTIQKVIKITLANQPYDIVDCMNEEELFQKLPIVQPKIVFLDFNLSDKYTGFELTAKIKSLSPSTKVLLLLGTFDTVEDSAMEKSGASDKIVKPFDSNKFIAICKQLVDTFADEESLPYPETKLEPKTVKEEDPEDQWTVSHSTEQKFETIEKPLDNSFPNIVDPLTKEMSDWGMSVPSVISSTESHDLLANLPPVIGEVKSLDEHRAIKKDNYEVKFPQNDDLDYPSMEEKKPAAPTESHSAKLISIDTFNEAPLEMEGSYVADESNVSDIEAQIRDEVEENLWQADEFEDLKKEVAAKMEEVKSNFQPSRSAFDESLFKPLDENETIEWAESSDFFKQPSPVSSPEAVQPDLGAFRAEMEEMVKKYVKEYMDELFQKNSEKVAWEVIPDLAENLIRQELSKISKKVMDSES